VNSSGRLRGRTVVVTGAASGIGAAVARGVVAEGGVAACVDVNLDGARAVADSLDAAFALSCDVTVLRDVQACFDAVLERAGRLDGLVHSAGGSRGQAVPFLELDERRWREMVDRNLTGSFHCGLVAARHLAAAGGGAIVLISSQLSLVVRPGLAHYCAAKGGVAQLVKGMALDLAPHHVRVNAVAPGPTQTPGNSAWFDQPDVVAEHARTIPMGRVGQPHECVGAVVHLLSDEASFTTGATLLVDGGYTII
jgi:NAD(P)-dependent dehydrogenase (short-subunit alcohol dehydrogenase family)